MDASQVPVEVREYVTELDRVIVDALVGFADKHAAPIEAERKTLKSENAELRELYAATMDDVVNMQRRIQELEQRLETGRLMIDAYDMADKLQRDFRAELASVVNHKPLQTHGTHKAVPLSGHDTH